MGTLFEKIIAREIPADIVHEDDLCLAFKDINPQAPVHILIIPKKPIARVAKASEDDEAILGHLLLVSRKIAEDAGVLSGAGDDPGDGGYRLVINNGVQAGESVPHLHVHLLGGRPMKWPPG